MELFNEALDGPLTTPRRAVLAWQVLVGCATRRQIITYGDIAVAIGLRRGAGRFLGPCLDSIYDYCGRVGAPDLTIIAVNAGTGRPGSGLPPTRDVDRVREGVFKHPWHRLLPPTMNDVSD